MGFVFYSIIIGIDRRKAASRPLGEAGGCVPGNEQHVRADGRGAEHVEVQVNVLEPVS